MPSSAWLIKTPININSPTSIVLNNSSKPSQGNSNLSFSVRFFYLNKLGNVILFTNYVVLLVVKLHTTYIHTNLPSLICMYVNESQ